MRVFVGHLNPNAHPFIYEEKFSHKGPRGP